MSIAATRATRSAPSRGSSEHPPAANDGGAEVVVVVVDDDLVSSSTTSKPTSASRVPLTSTREACEVSVLTATSMGSSRPASARDRTTAPSAASSAVKLAGGATRRASSVAGGVARRAARHPSGFSAPRSPSRRTRAPPRASRASPAAEASRARGPARAPPPSPREKPASTTRASAARQSTRVASSGSREGSRRVARSSTAARKRARHGARVARPRLSPRARARVRARDQRERRGHHGERDEREPSRGVGRDGVADDARAQSRKKRTRPARRTRRATRRESTSRPAHARASRVGRDAAAARIRETPPKQPNFGHTMFNSGSRAVLCLTPHQSHVSGNTLFRTVYPQISTENTEGRVTSARGERERTRSRASPRARSREPGVAVLRLREGASAVASPPPRVSSRGEHRPDPSPDPTVSQPTTPLCPDFRPRARARVDDAASPRRCVAPRTRRSGRREWRRTRARARRPFPRAGATRGDGCAPARWVPARPRVRRGDFFRSPNADARLFRANAPRLPRSRRL